MPGGLIQIVAYGHEDVYLTAMPQITFFKVVYRRYTNFSMETYERTINDNPGFGRMTNTKLYRQGDLITNMYLRIVLNGFSVDPCRVGAKAAYVRRLGHALIRYIEINIGGITIDRQYGTWLDIWFELATQGKKDRGELDMIGDVPELTEYNGKPRPEFTLFIPLRFWFNRHVGLALPYVAIQYHDIYIKTQFENKERLLVRNEKFDNFDEVKILDAGYLINYIYLDTLERRKFAQMSHEYLIEQVQCFTEETVVASKKRVQLDFNNPTKELIWVLKNGLYTSGQKFLCYTHEDCWDHTLQHCAEKLVLNSSALLMGDIEESSLPEAEYEMFPPGITELLSTNGNLMVTNQSAKTLYINFGSLQRMGHCLLDKVKANVMVTPNNRLVISNIVSCISIRDVSLPVSCYKDTRVWKDDVIVYQHDNYGILIDYTVNPLLAALFEWNDQERVQKRDGEFFGRLQPYLNHSNTPRDGVNLYSFALEPEKHQPSGTANLSTIENQLLTFWFDMAALNEFTLLYIYGFSYNVLRMNSGLVGLAYSG